MYFKQNYNRKTKQENENHKIIHNKWSSYFFFFFFFNLANCFKNIIRSYIIISVNEMELLSEIEYWWNAITECFHISNSHHYPGLRVPYFNLLSTNHTLLWAGLRSWGKLFTPLWSIMTVLVVWHHWNLTLKGLFNNGFLKVQIQSWFKWAMSSVWCKSTTYWR